MKTMHVGVLATHPVQYQAPLYRRLAQTPGIDLTVHFCHRPDPEQQGAGFGVPFQWDVNLVDGYRHIWLRNTAPRPSVARFRGCDTPEIAAVIREGGFDAFMVQGWNRKSYWQAFKACWQTGTPLIVRSDSQLDADGSPLKRALKKTAYPLFIRRFDMCLAYGQRSLDYFNHYGAKRSSVSPHFVDNKWFADRVAEIRQQRAGIRTELGLGQDSYVFLFVGKFEEKKRPLDIIRALVPLARPRGNDVALLMVGDGVLRPACERTAADGNLPVIFGGFFNQSELPAAYAAADCLVLASDARETWGLVVNEAMACGLPVIVSGDAGCTPDLVVEDVTGYSYPCGTVSELSSCMERLAENRELSQRLGAAALDRIHDYSVERAAVAIMQVLHDLRTGS